MAYKNYPVVFKQRKDEKYKGVAVGKNLRPVSVIETFDAYGCLRKATGPFGNPGAPGTMTSFADK